MESLNDGIAVVGSHHVAVKSHDTHFPFRQNSHFRYLTGLTEPDSILVLLKKDNHLRSIAFVRPSNAHIEMWEGRRLGVERAREFLNVDQTFSIEEFDQVVKGLVLGHQNLYIDLFENAFLLKRMQKILKEARKDTRKQHQRPPENFFHLNSYIENLRLIKDQNEIQFMKEAMVATNLAHRAAMALAAPGRNEKEVCSLINYLFTRDKSQGSAYENIVASGDNATILHYTENNAILRAGDLLLVDAGSHLHDYATDITRSFPVDGKFSSAQKDVYSIVLDAQKAAISHAAPGRDSDLVHQGALKILTQGLLDLNVLRGSVDENLEKKAFQKYYPHGTGHWLGLDVHDQNPYFDEIGVRIKFTPGMIFTVEPGLYFPQADSTLPSALRGIGVRIEDNILITDSGHQNLSAMIPKEIKELEEACQRDVKEFLC